MTKAYIAYRDIYLISEKVTNMKPNGILNKFFLNKSA